MKKLHVYIVLTVLSIYLTGCSSSSDGGNGDTATAGDSATGGETTDGSDADGGSDTNEEPASSRVSQLGFVFADEEASGSEVYLYAIFAQLKESAPSNFSQESFQPPLDICEVTDIDFSSSDSMPGLDDDTEFSTISAGETILFTSSAGTFAELQRGVDESGITFYESNVDPLAGPLPDGLILDIPGDEFPAFSNIAVPKVDVFELSSPAFNEVITPASVFTWEPGNNPNSFVTIGVSNIDFSTSKGVAVSCVVTDDGSFAFPTATQTEMGADFSSSLRVSAIRNVFTITQQAESILVVSSTSGE